MGVKMDLSSPAASKAELAWAPMATMALLLRKLLIAEAAKPYHH
jgi:hypothetical protein